MKKILYIVRGLPGSGKSTLVSTISDLMFEADSYFYVSKDPETGEILNRHQYDGVYEFDSSLLKEAHIDCQKGVEDAMKWGVPKIGVSNTFTMEWEMDKYFELAETYGYMVFSIIVENRHNGINTHNVPDEHIEKMRNRFSVKL